MEPNSNMHKENTNGREDSKTVVSGVHADAGDTINGRRWHRRTTTGGVHNGEGEVVDGREANNSRKKNGGGAREKGHREQACAACKHQKKKCVSGCELAPYFPAERVQEYNAVHEIFGLNQAKKFIKNSVEAGRSLDCGVIATDSIVWEAKCWKEDPIGGPFAKYEKCLAFNKWLFAQNMEQMEEIKRLKIRKQELPNHMTYSALGRNSGVTGGLLDMVNDNRGVNLPRRGGYSNGNGGEGSSSGVINPAHHYAQNNGNGVCSNKFVTDNNRVYGVSNYANSMFDAQPQPQPYNTATARQLGIQGRDAALDFNNHQTPRIPDIDFDCYYPIYESSLKLHLGDSIEEVLLEYPWIPATCPRCSRFGHKTSRCPHAIQKVWRPKANTSAAICC